MVKYQALSKKEAWTHAWDLRRLYTFAYRRQLDADKRGQKPRDRRFLESDRCRLQAFGAHYAIQDA